MRGRLYILIRPLGSSKRSSLPVSHGIGTVCMLERSFSVLARPSPSYTGHVPLNRWEKAALAAGSALVSLTNPRRADMIASLGEATASPYFINRLRDSMLASPTGRRILRDRPRITSQTIDMGRLRGCAEGTLGEAYLKWLKKENVSPDTRSAVKYVDDEECAYVMQRYRESHDFLHALCGLPTFVEGEVALKAFEFANTLLPMTGLSLFALLRMKPSQRSRFYGVFLPWAFDSGIGSEELINVYWEEELESDVTQLRDFLGIKRPPDLRRLRRASSIKSS